jgi:hypothetical protein
MSQCTSSLPDSRFSVGLTTHIASLTGPLREGRPLSCPLIPTESAADSGLMSATHSD